MNRKRARFARGESLWARQRQRARRECACECAHENYCQTDIIIDPPAGAKALEWAVHARRFASKGFELARNKTIPPDIRASIRSKFK